MKLTIRTFESPDHETDYIAVVEGWANHNISAVGCTDLEAVKEVCEALIIMLEVEIEDGYAHS